jgi:hypothetical protein
MNPTHEIHVCDGRSCRTFGGPNIKARLDEANQQGIFPEGTQIFTSGCLGPCASAPNLIVDTEFMQNVDPTTIVNDVKGQLHEDHTHAAATPDTPEEPKRPAKPDFYEDPDMRQPTTRIGLTAEDIMKANNFLGDL